MNFKYVQIPALQQFQQSSFSRNVDPAVAFSRSSFILRCSSAQAAWRRGFNGPMSRPWHIVAVIWEIMAMGDLWRSMEICGDLWSKVIVTALARVNCGDLRDVTLFGMKNDACLVARCERAFFLIDFAQRTVTRFLHVLLMYC